LDSLYAGIASLGSTPFSGQILPNDIFVHPQGGYDDDSLYSVMSTPGFSIRDPYSPRVADYNCVMTFSHIPEDFLDTAEVHIRFLIGVSTNGLAPLKDYVNMFKCGNANRDVNGTVNLGDVIYIANYKFKSGPEPFLFLSDVNGDCDVNTSDIIYLAHYCFGQPGYDLHCDCQEEW